MSFALVWLLLPLVVGCGPTGPTLDKTLRQKLAAVTFSAQDIEHLEKSAQERLDAANEEVKKLLQQSRPEVAKLSMAFGDLGKLLHAYGVPLAARPCYENALYLSPDEPLWAYLLGHTYRRTDTPQVALPFFQRALAGMDQSPKSRPQRLAVKYWIGDIQLRVGELAAARKQFESVSEEDGASPFGPYGLGRVLLRLAKPREAAAQFEKAVQAAPNIQLIHYQLMLAYQQAGEPERARIHQQKFLRRGAELEVNDPWLEEMQLVADTARVYRMRGNAAMARGDYDRAIGLLQTSLEREPDAAPVHLNLGMALIQKGRVEEAKRAFRRVIQLQPRNFVAHLNLASVFAATRSFRQAKTELLAAVKLEPRDKRALLMLANVHRRLDELAEAKPLYQRALQADPGNEQALVGYATLMLRMRAYSQALERFEVAHRVLPNNQLVIHLLSRLLSASPGEKERDGKRSLQLAQLAVDRPGDVMYAETRAMALAELKQFAEAQKWQRVAIARARAGRQTRKAQLLEQVLKEYQANRPWRMAAP